MEFMEKKYLIIIAVIAALFFGFSLIVDKSQEVSNKSFDANPEVELNQPMVNDHQAFVRPELKEQQLRQARTKQQFNKKMARFKKQNKLDTDVIETRAHEFHSDKGQTLLNNDKKKGAKTGEITEEQKQKNQEAIEDKVAEQCEYHKDPKSCAKNLKQQLADQAEIEKCQNTSKEDTKIKACKAKVTKKIAERKEKEKIEKAEKEAEQKRLQAAEKAAEEQRRRQEARDQEEDESDSESNDPNSVDPSNNAVPFVQNQTPNGNDPSGANTEDDKPALSLDEWRSYLEEEGGNLLKKASELVAATQKSGKENLPQAWFFTLINEYYLQSTDVEIQRGGVQALQNIPGVTSFKLSLSFFNQKGSVLGPLPEPYNDLFETSFKLAYENPTSMHVLGQLLKPTGALTEETSTEDTTTISQDDHTFVALNFIDDISSKLKDAIGEQTNNNEVYVKYSPYLNSLNTSINPGLLELINSGSPALKEKALSTLPKVEGLIERINALKSDLPADPSNPGESFFGDREVVDRR